MKCFSIFILLVFIVSSNVKADDIRDYQLEGISIGDSLLSYFDEKKIKNSKRYDNKNTSWTSDKMFQLRIPKVGSYTEILFALKKNDKNYIIYGISGLEKMEYNISDCYPKLKQITKEFKNQFPNTRFKKNKSPHRGDKSKKSMITSSRFIFKSGDFVVASCYDWSKKMKYWDNFRISLTTKEFDDWIVSNNG
jgi:hypothetical protein